MFANGNLILGGIPACSGWVMSDRADPGACLLRGMQFSGGPVRVSKMDTPAVISWVRVSAGGYRLNNERGRVSPRASPKGPQQGRVSDAALGDRPIKAPDSCSGARNRSSNRPDPNQAWFLGAVGRQTAPWGGASGDSVRNSCEVRSNAPFRVDTAAHPELNTSDYSSHCSKLS